MKIDVPAWGVFVAALTPVVTFAAGGALQWSLDAASARRDWRLRELDRRAEAQRSILVELQDAVEQYVEVVFDADRRIALAYGAANTAGKPMPTGAERAGLFLDGVTGPTPEWHARLRVEKFAARTLDKVAAKHASALIETAKNIVLPPEPITYAQELATSSKAIEEIKTHAEAIYARTGLAFKADDPDGWLKSLPN